MTNTVSATATVVTTTIQPLTASAFEAWQVFCQMAGGRTPLPWTGVAALANAKGSSLEEQELRDLVRKDEIPEEHQACSFPGCDRKVSPLRTALLMPDGKLVLDKRSGEPIWRGSFLVIHLKDTGLTVQGFCTNHLGTARKAAEEAAGIAIHPQPFQAAVDRREGILDGARRRRESQDAFAASLSGRSSAVRGQFGSAPRVSGDYAGGAGESRRPGRRGR